MGVKLGMGEVAKIRVRHFYGESVQSFIMIVIGIRKFNNGNEYDCMIMDKLDSQYEQGEHLYLHDEHWHIHSIEVELL